MKITLPGVLAATVFAAATATSVAQAADAAATIERGRYLVQIGGCNDCHTPGYAEAAGKMPESDWLMGSRLGFQGPWGTTYPSNLRLAIDRLSEEQWLARARQAMRPPMPWFNLRDMTDGDLRAIYIYVRSLGPKGEPAPSYAAPGQSVDPPYFVLVTPTVAGEKRASR